MGINKIDRAPDAWDKVAKALTIANQGIGAVAGIQSIRESSAKLDKMDEDANRLKQGIVTPKEQLEYSKDYNVSDTASPGSVKLRNFEGNETYYSPKNKNDAKLSAAMTQKDFAELQNKGFTEVAPGTKGATTYSTYGADGEIRQVGLVPPTFSNPAKEAKLIPATEVVQVNTGNTAIKMLDDLGGTISSKSDNFGPIAGRLGSWNPYNKDSQVITAQLKTAAQKIGTYLEGGKLTDNDVPKYEKMLPQLSDPPEVAASKLDLVKRMIITKQKGDVEALDKSGYNTKGFSNSGGLEVPNLPKQLAGKNTKPSSLMNDAQAGGQKMSPDDIKALKWAQSNKDDPRAKEIISHIKGKGF